MLISIGCDICNIQRFSAALNRQGHKLIKKLFTAVEIERISRRSENLQCASYAKLFAAKEAIIKVLQNTKGFGWHHMEISVNQFGAPQVKLYGGAHLQALHLINSQLQPNSINDCEPLIEKNINYQILLSLSDDAPYALAYAALILK